MSSHKKWLYFSVLSASTATLRVLASLRIYHSHTQIAHSYKGLADVFGGTARHPLLYILSPAPTMNAPRTGLYPESHSPRIHPLLAGHGIEWIMSNSPYRHQYRQCENDYAFPAERLRSVVISIPSPMIPTLSFPSVQISRDRPLTVGDVITALYEHVNSRMQCLETLGPHDKFQVDVARRYRAENTPQSMQDSYNTDDLYDLRMVDYFCLVSCFDGLEYVDGTWRLKVVTDQATFRNMTRVCQGYYQGSKSSFANGSTQLTTIL